MLAPSSSHPMASARKRSQGGAKRSPNPKEAGTRGESYIQPQFINFTDATSLDKSTRTKVRVQVMRDYHRRRQIQLEGKQSGRVSPRPGVKGQTHKFRLSLEKSLRPWIPVKAKKQIPRQSQIEDGSRKNTPKANSSSSLGKSQSPRVESSQTEISPATRSEYTDAIECAESGLDVQIWTEPSSSEFYTATVFQWMSSLNLALESAALYNNPSSGSIDPFSAMSLLITSRTQLLLHHYFSVRLQPAWLMMPMRKGLFSLALHDAALFHTFLSHYIAAYNSRFQVGDPAESVQHRTRAIQIINDRLKNSEQALSDGNIAAVANMAVYESSNGSTASMIVHLNGLEEMVNMRGGLENGGFTLHVQRLIGWTDLHCASAISSKPRFPPLKVPVTKRPEISPISLSPVLEDYYPRFEDEIDHLFHQIRELSGAMHKLRSSAVLPQEDIWYSDKIYYLQRSFFDIIHNPNLLSNSLDAACGIAGLIYCTHCLRDIPFTFQVISKAVSRLKSAIEGIETEQLQVQIGTAGVRLLWVLGLGGVAAEGKRDRSWFAAKFKEMCGVMGLIDWESTTAVLESVLWQEELNDAGGRLWDESRVVAIPFWSFEG